MRNPCKEINLGSIRQPCELLLIDGDTLVYRYGLMNHTRNVDFDDVPVDTGAAACATLGWPTPPSSTPVEPVDALEAAKLAISQKLQFLLDDTGVPDFRIALANPGVRCFRYGFYPQYKAHRGVPPEIIRPLRNWLRRTYFEKLLEVPEGLPMETDDILGYHHQEDGRTCIVSNDKDFMTLPGWNYHPFTGELRWITPDSAKVTLFYQILVGDGADGFPGCPGIGPMKAEEILMTHITSRGCDFGELWDTVHFAFLSQGATEDDLKTTFCLAKVNGCPTRPSDMWSRELPPHYKDLLKEIASGT